MAWEEARTHFHNRRRGAWDCESAGANGRARLTRRARPAGADFPPQSNLAAEWSRASGNGGGVVVEVVVVLVFFLPPSVADDVIAASYM